MSCCRRQRSRWCSRRGPDETPLSTSARTVRPVTSPTSTAATAELSAVVSGAAARAHIAMSRSPSTTSSLLHPERMIHQEAAAKFHGARVNLRSSGKVPSTSKRLPDRRSSRGGPNMRGTRNRIGHVSVLLSSSPPLPHRCVRPIPGGCAGRHYWHPDFSPPVGLRPRNSLSEERFEGNAKDGGDVLECPDKHPRQPHSHLLSRTIYGIFAFVRRSSQLSGQPA